MKSSQNRLNSIRFNQGFEAKLVVKRYLLTVSLPSYLFLLNTCECAQFAAMWDGEKVQTIVKRQDVVCRE